jgi:hypothetical protein
MIASRQHVLPSTSVLSSPSRSSSVRSCSLPSLSLFCSSVLSLSLLALPAQAQNCAPAGDQSFVCGAINPEDLVQVPGTDAVLSSGMADGTGFYHVNAQTGALSTLGFMVSHDAALFPLCPVAPTPQTLNTHGLNIRSTGAGRARLHVVGHGAREAIEVFDVDATGAVPQLTWIGCVLMPEGLAANSVASLADGSLLATVLFMPGKTFEEAVVLRQNTGAVFEWSPGAAGFTLIEGSELPANNGIETSADGSEFYVASSGLHTIVAFARENPTRQLRSTRLLPFTPDNVHMGPDGLLYTAGMEDDVPECGGIPGANHSIEILSACPRGSIAVAIDPATMEDTVVVHTQATPAFSNATMALPVGDELWLGTFSGNRIARAPRLSAGE